jgi:hypothetical protein
MLQLQRRLIRHLALRSMSRLGNNAENCLNAKNSYQAGRPEFIDFA